MQTHQGNQGEKLMTDSGTTESRKRQAQVEAGAYDGRYKTKVVEDKKKKAARIICRKFKQTKIED
jgi:hypothetical protein